MDFRDMIGWLWDFIPEHVEPEEFTEYEEVIEEQLLLPE